MIWAKQKFAGADYAPYLDRLAELQLANGPICGQFIMVAKKAAAGEGIYFVGVPNQSYLAGFDGFEVIPDSELPTEVDYLLLADISSDEYRFHIKTPGGPTFPH